MAKFDKVKELNRLRESSKKPVFQIFDGNFYLHRALHTMPPYTNKEGVPVGAVAGALSMFCADYSLLKPKYCAICFDVPGANFRHLIFEDYKKNDPSDVANYEANVQLFILVRLCRLVGFPVIFLQGVEADDTVGALAHQASTGVLFSEPANTVIQTGDKDLLQFVRTNCVTIDTRETGWLGTVKTVTGKFGVPPSQIADYLALMGDKNDNVPGLVGVGPVKARQLLAEFRSIQGILDSKTFDTRWKKIITPSSLADLRMCYALTKIRTDVNVARYGPFTLHAAHSKYLLQALSSLGINRVPPLVKAQLELASMVQSPGLFGSSNPTSTLVENSAEWDGLSGRLWNYNGQTLDQATFI